MRKRIEQSAESWSECARFGEQQPQKWITTDGVEKNVCNLILSAANLICIHEQINEEHFKVFRDGILKCFGMKVFALM
jgi:hypothetical protein